MRIDKAGIDEHFHINLDRVDSLLRLHVGRGQRPGNPPRDRTDILRAAVVFLHMALDDYLRVLGKWKWEDNPQAELINAMRIRGGKSDKFTLGDLLTFSGKSIDDVIQESIEQHFDSESFNNVTSVVRFLSTIGIDEAVVPSDTRRLLEEMMNRRHHIVHQGDVNTQEPGRGVHRFRRLGQATVLGWRNAVEQFQQCVDPYL